MLFSKTKKGLVTKMKISTKGRYAIKLMLDLALYSKGQPVKIKEIAKRQAISGKLPGEVQNIEKSLNTIIEQFEEMKKDLVFLLSENKDQQN